MKLIMCVVNIEDSTTLINNLSEGGFWTSTVSALDHIQQGKVTVFVKAEEMDVPGILATIKEICPMRTKYVNPLPPIMEPGEMFIPSSTEEEVSGAAVFVFNVEQFYQF